MRTMSEKKTLELTFSTGKRGIYSMAGIIARPGSMVIPLRDDAFFCTFSLELGALTWPHGFDLSPSAIHREMLAQGLLSKSAEA